MPSSARESFSGSDKKRWVALPCYRRLIEDKVLIMCLRARKFVVFAVAAALAVANGFAPRGAQASMHPHAALASGIAQNNHDTGADHHHGGATSDQTVAKASCHDSGQVNPQSNSPFHNCCVASCSTIAFIDASWNFDSPLLGDHFQFSSSPTMIPSTPTFVDPPPR